MCHIVVEIVKDELKSFSTTKLHMPFAEEGKGLPMENRRNMPTDGIDLNYSSVLSLSRKLSSDGRLNMP